MTFAAPQEPGIPLARFTDATVLFDGTPALDGLTLTLYAHEHVALLGPNGSGKSTLIRTLTRDVHPLWREEGPAVTVFGRERWDLLELRGRFGVVSADLQDKNARAITVEQVALSGFFGSIGTYRHQRITPEMRAKAAEVLEFVGVSHLAARRMSTLSTGEARRALVARALMHDPDALVLDEPYAGLDPAARFALRDTVRRLAQGGTTIVLVTHDISDIVPEIGRVVMLKAGRVFRDGPKAETLTSENVSALFGIEATVTEAGGWYHLW